uniref:Variant surface glycoprotein 1888 n=1 Tax=Trypanosoma brucei TaxID=5691 RepID=M4SXK8_9TRYP|nr:variant surface glycoprotein 1888 [Trypanosoma brucei]
MLAAATSAILALIVGSIPMQVYAAPAAGEHAHLFLRICELINLAELPVDADLSAEAAKASYLSIVKLNNSVGSDKWRQVIKQYTIPAPPGGTTKGAESSSTTPDPRETYWKETAKEVSDDQTKKAILAAAGLDKTTPKHLAEYRRLLRPIAEQAFQALKTADATVAESAQADEAGKARTALKIAAYGRKDFTAATATDDDCKGVNKEGSSRTLLCGAAATDAKAVTLAQILLCVCGRDNNDNNNVCENSQQATALNIGS